MSLKVRKNLTPPEPPTCALTKCMSLLGGAWTPNVIWYLSNGPRRFSELRLDIPPVTAKVLSSRLKELEAQGVLTRSVVATSPPSVEYELTKLGKELLPAIKAIVDVGERLKQRPRKL
jgi:DNA-binding HxlR family transcriptional regulator